MVNFVLQSQVEHSQAFYSLDRAAPTKTLKLLDLGKVSLDLFPMLGYLVLKLKLLFIHQLLIGLREVLAFESILDFRKN